ncbi:MAG TPA: hypothetical protein VF681_01345 [Abditibacteriaceae bacterium]|jgi:hypothetical protein
MKIIFFVSQAEQTITICSLCNDDQIADGLVDWRQKFGPEVDFCALDCPDWQPAVGELISDNGEVPMEEAAERVQTALERAVRGEDVPELISLDEIEDALTGLDLNAV